MAETPRVMKVRRVPYSSIVGQSIELLDEHGAHICQLPIVGLLRAATMEATHAENRAALEAMAGQIVDLINLGIKARGAQ